MITHAYIVAANSLPDNIWWQTSAIVAISGIVGSIVTAYGVHRTNVAADAREERRLKHDSLRKELDRKFDLKQAKYLAGILQIKQLPLRVATLVDTPLESVLEQSTDKELVAAYAELELIAPLDVLKAWAACMEFWGRSFLRLFHHRQALDKKGTDASHMVDQEVRKIMESEVVQGKCQLRGECLGISTELTARLTNIVVEMRNDLGFDIDRRAYEMLVIKNSKEAREAGEKSIVEIQRLFTSI